MLPTHRGQTPPGLSPRRLSVDGLQSRRASPLRALQSASPVSRRLSASPNKTIARRSSFVEGIKASPLRNVRRALHFKEQGSTTCSVVESLLCFTGLACILVFMLLHDFNKSIWIQRIHDRPTASESLRQNVLPWRGSNISAYPHDDYAHHWEGKKCEAAPQGNGNLPAVLVIGVHKGGSSALFQYLAAHGSIRPSFCKEAHFFDWRYNALLRDFGVGSDETLSSAQLDTIRTTYRRYFRPQVAGEPPFISIEGTPNYFHSYEVPARTKQLLPSTQIVVTMRNPMDRAISHFIGQKSREFRRYRTCSAWFNEYAVLLRRCDKLRPVNLGFKGPITLPMQDDEAAAWRAYSECAMEGDNPVARGIYAPQLFNWLQSYTPDQMRIIQSEHLFENPRDEMDRLTNWLGIRPHYRHEQEAFQVVGSRHMQKFNARLVLENVKKAHTPNKVDCDKDVISAFYKTYEQDLMDLLNAYFPHDAARWSRWSEINTQVPVDTHKALQNAGVVPKAE
eukprot:m.8913 g.8913  ORF g.8913 m.8913 type:complete len:507 (-) comp2578_c0_seq2:115-1635(-)